MKSYQYQKKFFKTMENTSELNVKYKIFPNTVFF